MYPFGSGAPNNSQPPFGSGYPQQQQQQPYPGYPPQPGFAPQPGFGYPQSNQPGMPMPVFGGGFAPPPPSIFQCTNYPPTQSNYSNYPQGPSYPVSTQQQVVYPTAGYQPLTPNQPQQPYPTQQYHYSNTQSVNPAMHAPTPPKLASKWMKNEKGTPTVKPADNFDPVADAQALRKAMKGFGTDEDGLINIICRRSNEQRQQIAKSFKTHFGKDLIEDVKSEATGNFETLLVALLTPTVAFYVQELHDAMSGIGTDEDVLIEILCTMSNYEINVIKDAYLNTYGKGLDDAIASDTSGSFKRLLVSLCTAGRDESGVTDPEKARQDATELLRAGELRVGTDESTFNMVLCQRNYQQLRLVFEEYEKMCGHGFEKAIEHEFSGDVKEGLLAIVQCVKNKFEFFAQRLHKSMAGFGTTDKQLIRLIVNRCEIDMVEIKAAFEKLYGKSLKSWVKGDTSGHYKHAIYALIGENRS